MRLFHFPMTGVVNNEDIKGHISPGSGSPSTTSGLFKMSQQGHSHVCPRSVLAIPEHGTMARTLLAVFFNRPMIFTLSTT